jgi:type IV pilus assembly protein PilX
MNHLFLNRARQRGMVLITSLLMLVIVTMLGIALFRSFGLDEKIAGNMREKARALQAAETAEEYAESWITGPNATTAIACGTGQVLYTAGQICTSGTGLASPATMPWPTWVLYNPPSIPTGLYAPPFFYVTSLGPPAGGPPSPSAGTVYQIDAGGYGDTPNATAVVEVTYLVTPGVTCPGGCNP